MRKYIYFALFILIFSGQSYAQNWLGFSNSNYGGTNSMYFNPSTGADNRYYIYVNLAGMNMNLSNNYVEFKTPYPFNKLMSGIIKGQNVDSTIPAQYGGYKPYQNSYFLENLNGKSKYINLSAEIRGPAVMIAWNKQNTISFGCRQRFALQINDLAEPMARLLVNGSLYGFKDSVHTKPLLNQVKSDNAFGFQIGTYSEYSATYARQILRAGKHYLKGGLTLKRLDGQAALFIQNRGTQFNLINKDSLWAVQTDISYGGVREQYYGIQNPNGSPFNVQDLWPKSVLGHGYGMDLGFTYEYRPDHKKYESRLDGKEWIDNKKNKYEYKVGVAVVDIGNIKYNNPQYTYYHDIKSRQVGFKDTAIWDNIGSYNLSSTKNVDTAIGQVFGFANSSNSFTWVLPTSLNFNGDFKLRKNIYIGLIWMQSIRKVNAPGFRTTSLISIIPRYESKWFEVSTPITFGPNYGKLSMGLYARMGPVFIASDNIGGFFGLTSITGFDFYAGAVIPIYRTKPKDRDNDGVTDRYDRCVRVPGPWELRGCPDQDSDGVEDTKDRCPQVKGDPKLMGCPDKDKDGIPDDKDLCPDYAGPLDKKGCPDIDGDGVYDQNDKCPEIFGKKELDGCPDRDDDGVIDKDDKCPDLKGEVKNNGCPDKDGDGVNDNEDQCPDKAGPAMNKGCPDSDGDGLYDAIDDCPQVAGLKKFKGCPDKDLDNVPDKEDQCPDTYGDPINGGCPLAAPEKDRDKDGVTDDKDLCPDVSGTPGTNGCPDKDGDGVSDKEDKCPEVKGSINAAGCPDKDDDGVSDKEDKCPDMKGSDKTAGCPDGDDDGITDKEDACPDMKGSVKTNGCPDADNDGISDEKDECPQLAGLKQFKGCPDRDMDNVPDKDDKCPDTYGDPKNNGCPLVITEKKDTVSKNVELTAEEQDILKEAFENLEFNTGKSIINDASKKDLDRLAKVLKKQPKYKLKISGHTDNIGKPADNLKLSLSRAEEVKRYLVSKGINPNRIITEGFGDTRPVAENKDDEGRQKNRRVEFRIVE